MSSLSANLSFLGRNNSILRCIYALLFASHLGKGVLGNLWGVHGFSLAKPLEAEALVLLVDDNASNLHVMHSALRGGGGDCVLLNPERMH